VCNTHRDRHTDRQTDGKAISTALLKSGRHQLTSHLSVNCLGHVKPMLQRHAITNMSITIILTNNT